VASSHGRKPGGRTNRLVALSSAAVLTVYTAGYLRTRAAADRLQAADRGRVVIPDGPGDWSAAQMAPHAGSRQNSDLTPAASSRPGNEDGAGGGRKKFRRAGRPGAERSAASVESPVAATADAPHPGPATAVAVNPVAPTPIASTPVASTPVATTPVATTPVATPAPEPASAHASRWKDGTYSGWGTSRHGDIEATVVIANGRITSAQITQCWTRYSCSWVAHLQGQVVERQSPEVDYVSGATQSTNAFYYAVVQALSKAK